jgi:hypothetical protein
LHAEVTLLPCMQGPVPKKEVLLSLDLGAAEQLPRTLVPCWDDLTAKASWTVAVEVPSNLTALSNMQQVRGLACTGGSCVENKL